MIYIHIFVNIVLLLLFDYMCLSFSLYLTHFSLQSRFFFYSKINYLLIENPLFCC